MLRVLIAVFLVVVAASCFEEGDCLITNSHVVGVSLRKFSAKSKADTIEVDSIYMPGIGTVYRNDTLTQLFLPVDPALTNMQYVFRFTSGKLDTLDLSYDNFVIVPSPTCGALPYQLNLAVTETTTFGQDSIVITNPSLLRNVNENAIIYF